MCCGNSIRRIVERVSNYRKKRKNDPQAGDAKDILDDSLIQDLDIEKNKVKKPNKIHIENNNKVWHQARQTYIKNEIKKKLDKNIKVALQKRL